jgi:mono/diheme cytochrome c family protein
MKKLFLILTAVIILLTACGEKKSDAASEELAKKEKMAKLFGLTVFELDNGIGPVKEKLTLGPVDTKIVETGKKIFDIKCAQCHKLDERYTGPAQRDLVKRRTPEYIMNMILNPVDMVAKHPEAKKMFAQYPTQMTFQNVTYEDARNLLEYFRSLNNK